MSLLSRIRIPMIDAGEHEGVAHLLTELAARLPGRLEPLEWLVDTFGRTSDSFRLPDALAHLGDALAAAGKLDRAKDIFEQLVDREPESDSAKRKLKDVLRKLGLLSRNRLPKLPNAVDPETLQPELPEAPAPKVRPRSGRDGAGSGGAVHSGHAPAEPELDEETQKFIAQSLTDVDLFASYGLTQKAIGLLEAILRRAPTHTPTLEKLLDFVLGAGDDRRTAELAAQLEHIHAQRGDSRSGERFGELRRRFQRAAGLTDEEIARRGRRDASARRDRSRGRGNSRFRRKARKSSPVESSAEPSRGGGAARPWKPARSQNRTAEVAEKVPEIEIIEPAAGSGGRAAGSTHPKKSTSLPNGPRCWKKRRSQEHKSRRSGSALPKAAAPSNVEGVELPESCSKTKPRSRVRDELLPHEDTVAATEEIGKPQFEVPADADDPEGWIAARWRKFPQRRPLHRRCSTRAEHAASS